MSKTVYTEDHEYISAQESAATIGISNYAQEQLGDIVYVELPQVGTSFKKGDEIAVVESVKAASEIYAPADFTVTEINSALEADPAQVNTDAMGAGWLMKGTLANPAQLDELMDETAYAAHIA